MLLPLTGDVNFWLMLCQWQWGITIDVMIDYMAELSILHLADIIANNVWRNTIQISVDDVISTEFGWCYCQ